MSTIDVSKMSKKVTDASGKVISQSDPKAQEQDVQRLNFSWWKYGIDSLAPALIETVRFIARHQSSRMEQLLVSTRLYGNTSLFSTIGIAFTRSNSVNSNPASQRIGFNLCSSVIDTLTAKISKNKVTPTFISNGGDWEVQQKAEQMSKFTEGIFYQEKIHDKKTYQFRDAGAWGTGILHILEKRKKVVAERVLPHEIFIDLVESMVTEPQSIYRVRICDRNILLAENKDEETQKKIMMAAPSTYEDVGGEGTSADLVTVIDGIHLPSDPDADPDSPDYDGVRALTVGDQCLSREPYTDTYFPYDFMHYNKRLVGWWGQGACERLQNLQGEVNRLMILIQRSMWMGGSFKVLVENGSKVVSQHLNNDVGAIIKYTGTPPTYVTPPMIQQDIYPYVDSLIAKGYQQEGVSQLSASSQKPLGLDSGKALRVYNDIEADRQQFIQQLVETSYLNTAFLMIARARKIYKRDKKYTVMFPSAKFIETIDWKDIQLEEDEYVMKAFPVSSLADDMSGRLQDVKELAQAGMISPRTARKLLRAPDLEMADNLANAAEDLLHRVYEDILKKGADGYKPPEPFWDLELARQLGLEYYNYAQFHNCPPDKLNLVQKFLGQVKDLDDEAKKALQPPMPPPGTGAPQAVPAAPPVSGLLPNVPGAQSFAKGGMVHPVDDTTALVWAHHNPGHPVSKVVKAIHGVND